MNELRASIDISVVIAIGAVIIAAIPAWVAFMKYRQGLPKLALRVLHNVLPEYGLDRAILIRELVDTMQRYPSTSHYFVPHILRRVAALNEEDKQYERHVADLTREIQRAEAFYTGPPRPWDKNETTYVNGTVRTVIDTKLST